MIEEFLVGASITIGVLDLNGETIATPILELRPKTDWYDYEAKYTGKSKEITPAQLTPELELKCKKLTGHIYKLLNCDGVVRVDYILRDDTFYLLEVNTTPGLSAQSIIPQQIRAEGMTEKEFFTMLIEDALDRHVK